MTESDQRQKFPCKVELHVHLDGAMRRSTLLDIARRRGIAIDGDEEELRKKMCAYDPSSLYKVLEAFSLFMPIIAGDEDAIARVAYEFCEDYSRQGVLYVEARYSPHLMSNSIPNPEYCKEAGTLSPHDVTRIITKALTKGSHDFNIRAKSILCCMRNRPEWSDEVVELAKEFQQHGVVGIDLAGGNTPDDVEGTRKPHKVAFQKAKNYGIHRTVHAGEVGPASSVREALEELHAERIGHGYNCINDQSLFKEIVSKRIHLECCPISSIMTGVVSEDACTHPIAGFALEKANFSLNSDDPSVFDSLLQDNYNKASKMGLSDQQIIQTIFDAARSSFAPPEEYEAVIKDLVHVYGNVYVKST